MKDMNRNMSPRDRIVKRLVQLGVPLKQHDQTPSCLVAFIKDNRLLIPELVFSILPTDKDVARIGRLFPRGTKLKEYYDESLLWMQWMMFGCDPQECLKDMERKSAGQRAVCGALWRWNNLVYRCRTCEHDPTCAICVSCFENGNHKDHDYSVMHSITDGCCDCGVETAWKREGFCTNHKGANHMQPLSEELASSVGPILDTLLQHWQDKVVSARDSVSLRRTDVEKVANMLSSAVVNMLIDFCNCSDGLLSFASRRILECSGLLDVLIKAEKFLCTLVTNKLHKLFLKLLGVPLFKDVFAKVFVEYYPLVVNEVIKDCSYPFYEKHPLLFHCSVKIFTVLTLTLRLVQEMDLLGVLLGCLMDLFLFCVGEDGHLQVNKLINIYEAIIQVVVDVRYAMSHDEVHLYIARERPDISRAWLWLLSLVQGMDPQKRAIGTDTEDYDDYLYIPFKLCHYLGGVHDVLVGGAFYVASLEGMKGHMNEVYFNGGNQPTFPASASWLISECLKAIGSPLIPGSALRSMSFPLGTFKSNGPDIPPLRKKLRGGTSNDNEISRLWMDVDENQVFTRPKRLVSSPSVSGEKSLGQQNDVRDIYDMNPEFFSRCTMLDDSPEQSGLEEALKMLNLTDWPEIEYDVSSQEISFHIPLHRLLSLLFRKTLTFCYGETRTLEKASGILLSSQPHEFFGELLNGVNPCGFSAYVMENPLRLRVFCAQARAGMWFKNGDSVPERRRGTSHRFRSEKNIGDSAILLSEWYHTSQWMEPGVDLDLFLLQCCAALAPPELFVKRIQERFGLTYYTSLNLADHNEYEPVLVQEMLTLIIQIVSERRFCGLSTGQNLHRELVCKLAVMDATQKQLVKALPDDLSTSDQLQNILNTIAIYSKPSGVKEGKYSLRKESYRDLDLYYPRWNSRTLKTAEERYFRFYKGSASDVRLPRWTQIFEPLSTLSRIATSISLLQIVRAVTFYAVFTDTSSVSRAPDGVIVTALHLLWLALDICETQLLGDKQSCRGTSFPILAYATEEIDVGFSYEGLSRNQNLLSMLVLLMRKQKEENHYSYAEKGQCNVAALIKKVLKKFAQLSSTCMDNLKSWQPY